MVLNKVRWKQLEPTGVMYKRTSQRVHLEAICRFICYWRVLINGKAWVLIAINDIASASY